MNLSKIVGTHAYSEGIISFPNVAYSLAIAPNKSNNPAAPNYQLVFKEEGHPFDQCRLSGLFTIKGKENSYRGDILRNGKKQPFILELDKVNDVAIIGK